MIYLIFILFVLYMIGCCLDGPDLKPIWKEKVGTKLYKLSKKFYPPINLYIHQFESPRIEVYKTNYEPIKLQSCIEISERELLDESLYGFHNDDNDAKKYCIENAIKKCKHNLWANLENSDLIDIHINECEYNCSIDVIAELKVLDKK